MREHFEHLIRAISRTADPDERRARTRRRRSTYVSPRDVRLRGAF